MKTEMTAEAAPVMIPKASLPDCEVGETLKIVGEDGDNFIVEPDYEEAPEEPMKDNRMASKMKGHAPALTIVIGGKGGKPYRR